MTSDPTPLKVTAAHRAQVRVRLPQLMGQHEDLDRVFLAHQEALFERDLRKARRELTNYRSMIECHIREERVELLPIYATFGEAPRGGNEELFHDEHDKILQRLGMIEGWLSELEALPEVLPRDLIAAFDREATFKHLMEHHDLRERRFFFPALAAWCDGKSPFGALSADQAPEPKRN